MKLHKALKLRKKIAGEISKIKEQISSKNSYKEGQPVRYDVPTLLSVLDSKVNDLVRLKYNINRTNDPIQSDIYRLAELKGLIIMWSGVSTEEGSRNFGYAERTIVYKAQINEEEKDALVAKIQKEIDDIQESIDTFNYTTDLIE